MNYSNGINFLQWDSDFFGFPIGKLEINQPISNWHHILDLLDDSQFDLVYCFVPDYLMSAEDFLQKVPFAKWVDGKTTYLKPCIHSNNFVFNSNIHSARGITYSIKQIAIQTGVYSRFNTDKNFPEHCCTDLYLEWIKKSIDRSIADEVLVFLENNEASGLVTIGQKNGRADIGLVGVDQRSRGKGIANLLVLHAEQYAASKNFKEIQVVTQEQNIAARKLYEKCGFKVESIVNIFHIWKKQSTE